MAKDITAVSLFDLMPSSIATDEQVRNAARAIDEELRKIAGMTNQVLINSRIDELPEAVLDLLAWQWHVDGYNALKLNIEQKRKLLHGSLGWHRVKGTPAAIKKIVEDKFDGAIVSEWFDYGGEPYHFRVGGILSAIPSGDAIDEIVETIFAAKNVRSWLDEIRFERHIRNPDFYLAFLCSQADTSEIYPSMLSDTTAERNIYLGGVLTCHDTIPVYPAAITDNGASRGQPHIGITMSASDTITIYPSQEED